MTARYARLAQSRARAAATLLRQQVHLAPGNTTLRDALLRDADELDQFARHLDERCVAINANVAAVRRARRAA